MPYNKENLINAAKSASVLIDGCAFPVVSHSYEEFNMGSGQDLAQHPTLTDFINNTPFIKKQQRLRSRGFKVLRFTRGLTNLREFIQKPQVSYGGRSLNEQFLDGDRNVFVLHVQGDNVSLYYVLEYINLEDPLVKYL